MKKEMFDELTDLWSYEHIVSFIMEDTKWCDAIMQFIHENWFDNNEIELGELNAFAKSKGYPQINLEGEE